MYVIGLYLEKTSADARQIIGSSEDKRIVMHFVHDVTADELRDGWKEGFEKNYPNAAAVQDSIDQFQASMDDAEKGDVIELDFVSYRVDVKVKGVQKASIDGRDFQQAVLSIWLGPHPPTSADGKQPARNSLPGISPVASPFSKVTSPCTIVAT